MNILQILPELNVGGVETGTVDLSKYLVRQGHKVVVVSNGGELEAELKSCGAIHYSLAVHRKSFLSIIRTVPRLAEIIKKEKIDIVHARSRVPAWIAYLATRKTHTVLVTTCHGYYRKHFFSSVMGWGKRVIAISNTVARHMIDDFSVPRERIKLVWRSVDLERFKYTPWKQKKRKEEFHIGIIGRITPLKGHLHFIKAMAKVSRSIPRIKIWIVGDAPFSKQDYKEQVKVMVKRTGLWHCTEFLGTQRDIPAILRNLDVLVLATTTQEAFGRVIIEAQACGVPVVATSVGGVVDVVDDGKTGILVPPADPDAMAAAVIKISKDQGFVEKITQNAYAKVKEKFNIELMAENTLKVYREALDNFNVLIIKFSSIGDVILSTAAIRSIRKRFPPNYKITCLVSDEAKAVLQRCPYIDRLIVCDFKNRDKGMRGLWALGASLRRSYFDISIDLQNNRKSHMLSFLSLAFERYGYNNRKFGFLLNRSIRDEKPALDPLSHQFKALRLLGIEEDNPLPELWPSEEDRVYIEKLFESEWISAHEKFVGLNINASPRWQTKSWPLSQAVKFCEELSQQGIRVVITGSDNCMRNASLLVNSFKLAKPLNACGKTSINQLAELIKKCSVFVSVDSAPLHVAAAVGVPFVGLFGPTDPKRHMPISSKGTAIFKSLKCSPCYRPSCKDHRCMGSITSAQVMEAVKKVMDGAPGGEK